MNALKNYFDFNGPQRNGILVLLVILLLILSGFWLTPLWVAEPGDVTVESVALVPADLWAPDTTVDHTPATVPVLFAFDPNELGEDSLALLGLNRYVIENLVKYRKAGGLFRSPADLKKIYGLGDDDYLDLKPYIRVRPDIDKDKEVPLNPQKVKRMVVELNQADTSELVRIRGIGTIFANRILKYRTLLGGFYKKEQLLEVYGIDSTKYQEIQDWVWVNPELIKKININKMNSEELRAHPYLSYQQAGAILGFRRKHGAFQTMDSLPHVPFMDEATFLKIAPYLKL